MSAQGRSVATLPAPRVAAATRATYAAFIGIGAASASWAARIPQIRDGLELTPASLGLILLAVAAGSLVALPLSGVIVHRFHSRRTVAVMAILLGVGMGIMATGYLVGVVPVVIGFVIIGFANGAWDVAMNVQGADVERHVGRAIMPRFHAGYSVGTVIGALVGVVMIVLHISVTTHLLVVAVLTAVVVPIAVRGFLPDLPHAAVTDDEVATVGHLARWKERRTLLIGVFVFAFAFAEGTGNDWVGIAVIDGYHTPAVIGTLGFATFLAAMTAARWYGPAFLDRYGRVRVVRVLAVLAVAGVALFVFSPLTWLAFVGAVLWGTGVSLGFPVGMSAAADDPAAAASRVSVVASIGYCAFLGGPPLVGFLGNQITVLKALTAVAVLMALAVVVAGALKPLAQVGPTPTDRSGRCHE